MELRIPNKDERTYCTECNAYNVPVVTVGTDMDHCGASLCLECATRVLALLDQEPSSSLTKEWEERALAAENEPSYTDPCNANLATACKRLEEKVRSLTFQLRMGAGLQRSLRRLARGQCSGVDPTTRKM